MRRVLIFTLFLVCSGVVRGQEKQSESLQLTLPPTIYAVAGVPTSIYFENIVLTEDIADYRFEITCDVGLAEKRRWLAMPKEKDVGNHPLKVAVFTKNGKRVGSKQTILKVIAVNAGATHKPIQLLIIGDSLTHASAYPNEIARRLSQPGNPRWRMLGTHKPPAAADGVVHEGYGGWTWGRFVTKYEPNPDGTHRKRSSPFVVLGADNKPALDLPRYVGEHCDGTPPDYIVIMLGINDCFGAPPDEPAEIDARVDTMFGYADKLLLAIRQAAPNSQIGLCLTTPPNSRQAAFQANYKDRYTRWGWKRIQHRLVQRQIDYVVSKRDPNISIVPTQLNLDPVDGYPTNNGVHPNADGYKDIGASVYSWLKWKLAQMPNALSSK